MDDQLHIIVAGDSGKVFTLPFSSKKLRIALTLSAVTLLLLTVTSIWSLSLYKRNCHISNQLVDAQEKLHKNAERVANYNKSSEDQWIKLNQKIARLELENIEQATTFKQEKESLISTAVDELNERSELIGRIIGNIGLKIPKNHQRNVKHSGGPFVQQPDKDTDELLFKADRYLNAIQCLPLGKPVRGSISSGFGKRKDPLNNKSAFHTGIDFRGNKGEPIYATADGIVKKAFRNGGYGNYVLIDHGNGYMSSFSHMQKYLVHKGDRVERGQVIGLVGNTGRSTGTHLHYEIALNNKVINPAKFLKVANLTKVVLSSPKKKKLL